MEQLVGTGRGQFESFTQSRIVFAPETGTNQSSTQVVKLLQTALQGLL